MYAREHIDYQPTMRRSKRPLELQDGIPKTYVNTGVGGAYGGVGHMGGAYAYPESRALSANKSTTMLEYNSIEIRNQCRQHAVRCKGYWIFL